MEYLDANNLIHPNLHGSRAGHNTATALMQLYDRCAEEIEDGKMVGVLVCDQSAAFDLCDHTYLLERLKLMGLEEPTAAWMGSYQSGRKLFCGWLSVFPTESTQLVCSTGQYRWTSSMAVLHM